MRVNIATAAVVLFATVLGCDLGSQPANEPSSITSDGIRYVLSLQRVVFQATDTVEGRLEAANITLQPMHLQFPNQHQLRWRLLNSHKTEVLTYPMLWLPAFSYLDLAAGEVREFTIRFALKDWNGHQLNAGTYLFEASLAREESPVLEKTIHVR